MKQLRGWCSGLLLALASSGAWAQGLASDDFTQNFYLKANALAFGGAYRAVADDAGSMLLNPAGMTFYKRIDIGFNYLHSTYNDANLLNGAVYDNFDGEWAFGFSFDRDTPTLSGNSIAVSQYALGISTCLYQMIGIGVTAKYFRSTSSLLFSGATPDGWSGDVGVMVRPLDSLSLGLVAYNLLSGRSRSQFPHQLGGGITVWLGDISKLSLDWLHDFNTGREQSTNLYFGGDLKLYQRLYLRGGFGGDMIYDNPFLSVGLGASGSKAALNVTYSRRFDPARNTIAVSFDIFSG